MIAKYFDINVQGLSIRCKAYFTKELRGLKDIVIATYGFGGNKDNKAVEKFADRLLAKHKNYGVICFDWPCHGLDARNKLILQECITYLDLVTGYVKDEMRAERLYNYSSSYGAYITLNYLHERGVNPYRAIAFRCAAVKMYHAMTNHITEDEWNKLNKGKEILRGHDRKIKITKDFLDDLLSHDVSQYDFMDYADDILLIHGTKDESAPYETVCEFSDNNIIELVTVENADHPFTNPDYMDLAINKIIEFFAKDR